MLLHVVLAREEMKYDYDELLKRACSQMPEVSLKRERLELPQLLISTIGMRTIISNFKEVADVLDRDPQHILKFLTWEMATAVAYHDSRAIFQGKFRRDISKTVTPRYTMHGSWRPVTTTSDASMRKEKRLSF